VADGIRVSISIYASLPFLATVALLYFYEINKAAEHRIERDLLTRRAAAAN
jgi:Na+/melibiose symporter-like transporter